MWRAWRERERGSAGCLGTERGVAAAVDTESSGLVAAVSLGPYQPMLSATVPPAPRPMNGAGWAWESG